MREISVLEYFSKKHLRNGTERYKRYFGGSISIRGGDRGVLRGVFFLVKDGIYTSSITCFSTVLVELAEVHIKSAELFATSPKEGN